MASEAEMVAMGDTRVARVAQVAVAAAAVHMAEAGWRSSRLGDGWERTGTDVGHQDPGRMMGSSMHHSLSHN